MSKVCIAKILTAHGVRGLVKIHCYLENPADLERFNPLQSENGKSFNLRLKNPMQDFYLAEIEGIKDRNDAEKLRNTELFIDRASLPDLEDGEVYYEDLIGLDALDTDGTVIGKVIAVENFGAGDLIEIQPVSGKTFYLPLAEPFVTDIQETSLRVDQTEEFRE